MSRHHHRNHYSGVGTGGSNNVVKAIETNRHMNSNYMITDESLSSKTSMSSSSSSISISSTSTSLSNSDDDTITNQNRNQNENENDTKQTMMMIQRLNEQLRVTQCKLLHANSYIKSLQIIQENCISLEEYHSVLHEIELLKQQQHQEVVRVVEINEENVEQQQGTNNDELMIANDTIRKLEQEIHTLKQQQAKNSKKKSKSNRSTTSRNSINSVDTNNMNHHNHNNISQDLFDAENTIYTLTQEIDQLRIELTSVRNKENNKDTNQNDRNTCINCKCTTSSQQQHPQQQQQHLQTTQQVELELQFLRKDRIKLHHQINQLRILLWNVEEQSHIYRLRLQSINSNYNHNNKLNHMMMTTTTNELQQHQHRQKNDNEQLHECIAKVASYKRKNNHYESLIQSLYHEIDIKNQIITIAQQQHRTSNNNNSNHVKTNNDNITESIAYDTELHRSLNIATELSIKNVEQQIQIDQLNDMINKIQKKQQVIDEVTGKNNHPTNCIVTSNSSSIGSSTLVNRKDTVLKVSMIPTNTTKTTSLSLSSRNSRNVPQTPTATSNYNTLCCSSLSSLSPSKNVQQKQNNAYDKVKGVSITPNTTSSPQQCTTTKSTTNTTTPSSSSSCSSSRKSKSILQMKIPHIDLTVSCGNVSGIHVVTTATTKTPTTLSLPIQSSPQLSASSQLSASPTTSNDSCVTGDNISNDTSNMEKIDVSSSKVNCSKDICMIKEKKHDSVTLKIKNKHDRSKADKGTSNDVKLSPSTSPNDKDITKTNAQIEDRTSLNQAASIVFI